MQFKSTIDDLEGCETKIDPLEFLFALIQAEKELDELYLQSVYIPHLRVSANDAQALKDAIKKAKETVKDFSNPPEKYEAAKVVAQAKIFRQVLNSELGVVPAYLLLPKGGYDVNLLSEAGQALFPEEISKVVGVAKDIDQAGKALAFELPTACGFHLFRVLEVVVKEYWKIVSDGKAPPKLETIGSYGHELKNNAYGDLRVSETLIQISALHRNPLIHPEVILSTDEAIGLIGIVRSVISAMLKYFPDDKDFN